MGGKGEGNVKNNRLLYVVVGIITTLFTAVTVTMWIQVNASITSVKEDIKAVCIMQEAQKDVAKGQKELLENHVEHLKETIDYIRDDIREIKDSMKKNGIR